MNRDRQEFPARLEAYLAGDLDGETRAAFEAEVLADPELAEEFASAVNLDAAVREATGGPQATGTPARRRRRRTAWWVLPVAAALAAVLLWSRGGDLGGHGTAPVLRGPRAAVRALEPVAPAHGGVDRFRWTRDPDAVRYRLEVLVAGGRLRHVALVADTAVVRGEPGFPTVVDSLAGPFTWRVVPLLADGREGEAAVTLTAPGRDR